MTRLIDADALKKSLGITATSEYSCKGCKYDTSNWSICDAQSAPSFDYACSQIDDAPTVDAVPVIRCNDCKFATITKGVYGREPEVKYCDIWFPNEAEYMPVNYFCASAERKEE